MSQQGSNIRYNHEILRAFGSELFVKSGLAPDRADIMAEVFLEADLLGFTTHGFNRISSNLEWLQNGNTKREGEPQVLVDRGVVFNWDANSLPGPYVVSQAMTDACQRAKQFGVGMATLRHCQHIACLATYLCKATEQGLVAQIIASSPDHRNVSPFGGHEPVFSPNPFAFGVPTEGDPILIDISLSIVAEGYVDRARRAGEKMPSHCLKDNQGNVSKDPSDYWCNPRGSIMPIGGLEHGHKGYGLCFWSELMTMALGNYGRADSIKHSEENSVFIQIIDPQAFGSLDDFQREAQFLADLCRNSRTKLEDPPVRVPGSRALDCRREQLAHGVTLYPSIIEDLRPWAEKLNVAMPTEM